MTMGAKFTSAVERPRVGDHAMIARTIAMATAVSTGTADTAAVRARAFSSSRWNKRCSKVGWKLSDTVTRGNV
jgi:hypothetical protein